MPKFSQESRDKRDTCDERLSKLLDEIIMIMDITVLYGYRDREEQDRAYETGNSTKQWPDSKHNKFPSQAFDIAPYPIDWNDRERFILMGGLVWGLAEKLNLPIRWGGSWDCNGKLNKENYAEGEKYLDDLCHFELI